MTSAPRSAGQGLDPALLARLREISFPTIGHFLEEGFVDAGIRSLLAGVKVVGRAVTVGIDNADAVTLNLGLLALTPGDVLVVDMHGDHRHAPVGAVTALAAQCAGAAAIVVDGVATDVLELRDTGLPVFARGTSALTTKRHGGDPSAVNVPVLCGGVTVHPGDLVLADDNGVVILHPETAAAVVDRALASDGAEPAILARLRAGEPLSSVLHLGAWAPAVGLAAKADT